MYRARMPRQRNGQPVRRAMLGAPFSFVLSAIIAVGIGVFGGASPASADTADAPIELSSDGIVWAPFLDGGLFDAFQGAVPGDSSTQSFFVRNPQSYPVTMKTRALDVVSSSAGLASSLTVQGEAGGVALAAPVTLGSLSDCATLAPDLVLGPLAVTKVTITIELPAATGGVTAQTSRGGFDVLLTMQDNAAGTPDASCEAAGGGAGGGGGGNNNGGGNNGGGGHHSGGHHTNSPTVTPAGGVSNPLAFTGVDGAATLFLGGALLALGFLFLIARRRRKTEQQEQ